MSIHNLDHLFHPTTAALVARLGAAAPGDRTLVANLCRSELAGRTVVDLDGTPRPADLDPGVHWLSSLEGLAPDLDLVVSTTPLAEMPGLLERLQPLGVRTLVATQQRRSLGDAALEAAVAGAARAAGIRVLGLNSFGLIAPGEGINVSRFDVQPRPGRVALVSQSGALISTILDMARERQLDFSHVVSLGSLLDIDFGDIIDYLAWEPEVRCLLLYVENLASVKKFLSACRSAARVKPIVAVKGGSSARGRELIATHTGRPSGEDRVYDTAFRRAGIIRVESIRELLASGEAFCRGPLPRGDRLGVVTNSGGIGVLVADSLARRGARLADLSPALRERLSPCGTTCGGSINPVCIHSDADTENYVQVLQLLLAAGEVDTVLVVMAPSKVSSPAQVAERLRPLAAASHVELVYIWHRHSAEHSATLHRLIGQGDVIYQSVEEATTAYCYARQYADNLAKVVAVPPRFDRTLNYRQEEGAARLASLGRGSTGLAADLDREALLGAYGLPLNTTRVAATLQEVTTAGGELGYPVAVSLAAGPGTASVWTPGELPGAYRRLGGDGAIVTLRRMVRDVRYELKLGVQTDVEFGPYLFLGTGGLLPGIPDDETVMLPPLNRLLARRLIDSSGLAARMALREDEAEQLEEILVRFSQLVVDFPVIRELVLDPLTLARNGFLVQASRLVLEDRGIASPHHLATAPYPNQYEFRETLKDGTPVLIRPIRPEDGESHYAFLRGLSSQTMYNRFFGFRNEISAEQMARFTQIDYDREVAIVARVEQPEGEITIGVNRLTYDPHNGQHEFAVVVDDGWQGSGVGRLLMEKIVAIAMDRGIDTIYGMILATNTAMLSLARKMGFEVVERDHETLTVRIYC
ncbi:MAG: GNAT family N-acetyltransferase [Deferrisomatales bacterium]|nr:GNAT family N-acetyltransferase [Deferrisomatales bacterium]